MVAVFNSSPLIHLASNQLLYLLPLLFSQVTIPPAVYEEVVSTAKEHPESHSIEQLVHEGKLSIKAPENDALVRLLENTLDYGESAAIALTMELKPDVLVIDEKAARHSAKSMGLPITGFLGLLIKGYKAGAIKSFKTTLDQAVANGFWLSPVLYQKVLREVE